jgi:ParB family chromosome partitioning protein
MAKQALEGKRGNLFLIAPEDLVIIGIDTAHKSEKEHPLYDPRIKLPVNENLVRNIMVYGVIDPIKVRKEGDDPVVVDGRQRLRAAREANKRLVAEGKEPILVPVIPKRGSDATMFGVLISANENRQNDDILAKIDKAGRMLDMGKTEDDIAIAFGVQVQTIKIWLKLLDVCDAVRKAVDAGQISPSAAAKLAGLNRDEQISTLKTLIESGQATTAQATAHVRAVKTGKETTAAPSKRLIKKMIEYVKANDDERLSEDFLKGVRWAIGDLPTSHIAGLSKLLGEAKDA